MKVVFDSNVYVSALVIGKYLSRLIYLALKRKFEVYLSDHILSEVQDTLKDKFDFSHAEINQVFDTINSFAINIKPIKYVHIIEAEPKDNRILECALAAKADYLVTGDKKHLLPLKSYRGIKIVTPREFLDFVERIN